MIEALAQKTEEAEWQLAMQKEAASRDAEMQASQAGLDWHDVRAWMLARAAGKTAEGPQVKRLEVKKAVRST